MTDKWSPDVVVGFALKHELFDPTIIPCTTALYYWIDREIMRTKNLDLLEKLTRKPKVVSLKKRPNKRIFEQSIDDRPKEINDCKTLGHWEIDTVIGNKTKTDAVLLILVERQTRLEVIMKVNGKDQKPVNQAIYILQERSGEDPERTFQLFSKRLPQIMVLNSRD